MITLLSYILSMTFTDIDKCREHLTYIGVRYDMNQTTTAVSTIEKVYKVSTQ